MAAAADTAQNGLPSDADASERSVRSGLSPAEARRLDTVLEALALHIGRLPGAEAQDAVVQIAHARQQLGTALVDVERRSPLQAPRLSLVEHRAVGQHLKALSACLGAMVDGLSHRGHRRTAASLLAANAGLTRVRLALEAQMEQVYGSHPEVYFRCGTSPAAGTDRSRRCVDGDSVRRRRGRRRPGSAGAAVGPGRGCPRHYELKAGRRQRRAVPLPRPLPCAEPQRRPSAPTLNAHAAAAPVRGRRPPSRTA